MCLSLQACMQRKFKKSFVFILKVYHNLLPFSSRLTQTDLTLLTATLVKPGGGGRAVDPGDVTNRSFFSAVLIVQSLNLMEKAAIIKQTETLCALQL